VPVLSERDESRTGFTIVVPAVLIENRVSSSFYFNISLNYEIMKHARPADSHSNHKPAKGPMPSAAALRGAAELFRAMGDVERLRLLELLKQGERCVSDIVETVGDKFSTVSQRLRILRDEGLITRRRVGQHLYYALADRHVADLIQNALAHADELVATPAHHREGD
jgi:ArsR family transcriptional regulator